METNYLMSTYNRQPVYFDRGEGVWLWDSDDRRYLDALSGIAVCVLGHAHPAVTSAIQAQAAKLVHTSNLYGIRNQERLGEKLCEVSGLSRVFFCNSGAEANEAAIKLARLYGKRKGIACPKILVFDGAFHGRTLAALTATGNAKAQAGFEPLVEGFLRLPYGDAAALETLVDPEIVAVLAEPLQGEGGVRAPAPGYLKRLREICERKGWLLMLDEVQTGMGRTGRWFAYQHEAILPDVLTLAKGLGNGFPIGACLARGQAADLFMPGTHGSTFGGNPLACSAALAVIETIEKEGLCQRAEALGQRLIAALESGLKDMPSVKDIRGQGLMVGIELDRPCSELVGAGLSRGILINVTAERVVRLLPPLICSDEVIDEIAATVSSLIREFTAGH